MNIDEFSAILQFHNSLFSIEREAQHILLQICNKNPFVCLKFMIVSWDLNPPHNLSYHEKPQDGTKI